MILGVFPAIRAPRALPEASVSMIKGREKLGIARTGAEVMADFNVAKALVASSFHTNASFFSKSVNGLAMNA